jgi:hypothetical protein
MRPDRVPCAAVADRQARAALAQIDAQAGDDGYAPGEPEAHRRSLLSESDARPAVVLGDELDAGRF